MDPIVHLRDLVPQPTDLLEMEAEELAGILLAAIQRSGHTQVSRHNTMLAISSNTPQIFDLRVARELPSVLAEAWAWLERECLLITKPTDPHWQVLSRRAKKIDTPADFQFTAAPAHFLGRSCIPGSRVRLGRALAAGGLTRPCSRRSARLK